MVFAVVLYWLATLIVQGMIGSSQPDDLIGSILFGIVTLVFGIYSYFLVLNVVVIAGLVISWRRKDRIAVSTFKVLVLLTMFGTTLFFVINW